MSGKIIGSLLLALGLSFSALGDGSVLSASNASATDSSGTLFTIYGGLAGSCTGDSDSTCDSCEASSGAEACNRVRIHNDLELNITFKITTKGSSNSSGNLLLAENVNGNPIDLANGSTPTGSQNSNVTLAVEWRELCQQDTDENTDCDGLISYSSTFRIGIDYSGNNLLDETNEYTTLTIFMHRPDAANGNLAEPCGSGVDGICEFEVFPGDDKLNLIDIQSDNGKNLDNLIDTIKPRAIRLFISETGFSDATPIGTDSIEADIEFDSDSKIDRELDGLKNGTTYYVRLAVIDKAQNVHNITSENNVLTTCVSPGGIDDFTPTEDATCNYMVTPDPVLGLLEEDFNCFIATATYGSTMHDKVLDFRRFRSQVLLKSSWGKSLTRLYYRYGKIGASFIKDSPALKKLSQIALYPVWLFSVSSMSIGFAPTLLLSLLLLSLIIFGIIQLVKKINITLNKYD